MCYMYIYYNILAIWPVRNLKARCYTYILDCFFDTKFCILDKLTILYAYQMVVDPNLLVLTAYVQ